jgi:aspartyl-tRNA synthetase
LLTGAESIRDVILFPQLRNRAEQERRNDQQSAEETSAALDKHYGEIQGK